MVPLTLLERQVIEIKADTDTEIGKAIPSLTKTAHMPDFDYPITAIHDDDYAKSRGFRGNLVGGSFLAGYVLQMLYRYFGRSWTAGGTIDVSFIGGGAISGDAVEAKGRIIDKVQDSSETRLFLDVKLENLTTGKTILVGKASCLI